MLRVRYVTYVIAIAYVTTIDVKQCTYKYNCFILRFLKIFRVGYGRSKNGKLHLGAGNENRTRISALGRPRSTTEPYPHILVHT